MDSLSKNTSVQKVSENLYLSNANRNEINQLDKEIFQSVLGDARKQYDIVGIDSSPQDAHFLSHVADVYFIPLDANLFSVKNVDVFLSKLHRSSFGGFVFSNVLVTRKTSKTLMKGVRASGLKLFDTFIRADAEVEKALNLQKSVVEYAPSSRAAKDYIQLTEEIITKYHL